MNQNKIKCDLPWLIYFVAVFCFYTVPVVQYAAHFLIWGYCFSIYFKRTGGRISRTYLRNITLVCGGYILLVLWAILSRIWAYDIMEGTVTLNGMLKILSVMLCMAMYIDNQHKVGNVLYSYVTAMFVMSVLIILTSPIYTYGTTKYGGITNQFRNTIANAVFFAIILVWVLSNGIKKYVRVWYMGVFLFVGFCTGSRRGIIQLIIMLLLYALTEKNANKKMKRLCLIIFVILLVGILLSSIPYLRDTYWSRLFSVFDTSVDDAGVGEASTVGRNIYRMIAMDMFRMRPLTGFGVDGFHCYLADHPYTYTTFSIKAVYSHCNYTELLADFGLIGFIFYYSLHFKVLKRCVRFYKENKFLRATLIIFLATLILDYGGISFQSNFAMYMYTILFIGVIYTISDYREGNLCQIERQ